MDGTKSSLTPSEPAPAAKDEKPATPQQQPTKPAEGVKPTLTVMKAADSGPPKTILKPGIAAQQAKQASQSAAASPAGEKATLKAKSPAPAPAKSPWAPLPSVQSVSPVNPPTQQALPPRTSLPPQDARAYDYGSPSAPAREMPADTFDRSWPGGEGAHHELFNSANGRYEPAKEHRRGSIRQTGSLAKPALLQRQSQQGQEPAEPSPAFQTRRESQTDGAPWTRRRGSSLSQASGPVARRASLSRPTDLAPAIEDERRLSTIIGHDMRAQQGPPNSRPNFNQQSAWDQQMPARPEAGAPQAEPAEDLVKAQERIMREKREEARKRKMEQEKRAEEEKQERLKAKMAELGGHGKSRAQREAEAAAAKVATSAKPAVAAKPAQAASAAPSTKKEERPAASANAAEVSAQVGAALDVQSLRPASPVKEDKPPSPLPSAPTQPASRPERPVSAEQQQAPKAHLSPRAPARAAFGQQSPYRSATSTYSSPGERKQQPFGRSPLAGSEALPGLGWNPPASNGNVWGTSGIGNGTFDKASSFAPMPISSHQGSALPPPPGMSRPNTTNRMSPQGLAQESRSPSLAPQQPQEQQQRAFPTPPGIDARAESGWGTSRNAGTSPAPNVTRQPHAPGPIAPPTRAQLQQQAAQRPTDAVSAWKSAAQRLPYQYEADAEAAGRPSQEPTVMPPPRDAVIKETFKKASVDQGRLDGPRRLDNTEYLVPDSQGMRSVTAHSPAPPSTQTQPMAPPPAASSFNERAESAENTVRIPDGSRNPAHGGFAPQLPIAPPSMSEQRATIYQGSVNFPTGLLPGVLRTQLSDKSPPPPETPDHPAFTGDARHPLVKLPHPAPRVKLPPASTQGPPQLQHQQSGVSMPRRLQLPGWGPPGVGGPIVQNAEWQARFNGLFQRTSVSTEIPPSPPKTPPKVQGPALAVTSSSRAAMDDLTPNKTATVLLPASPPRAKNVTTAGFTIDDSTSTTSMPTIDHVFTEELGFGSRPTIRIPRNPAYGPEMYNEPDFNLLRAPPTVKVSLAIDPQTKMPLPPNWWPRNAQGIFVKLHGTKGEKRNMLVKHANVPKWMGSGSAPAPQRKPSAPVTGAKGKSSGAGTPTANAGHKNVGSPASRSGQASLQWSAAPSPGKVSRQAGGQKEVAAPAAPQTTPAAAGAPPVAGGNESTGRKRGGWHPRAPRSRAAPAKAA